MVERQLRGRDIQDEMVLAAMAAIPRERFVLPGERERAYEDCALAIEGGQTISQPLIVAHMCELLEPDGRGTILEVGGGSGYAAAVMAECAESVVTIERDVALADRARATLKQLGIENVEVRIGDGTRGVSDGAPFERISVAATAQDAIPATLVEQLTPDGILVCPVRRGRSEQLIRLKSGVEEAVSAVRFVALVEDPTPSRPIPPTS